MNIVISKLLAVMGWKKLLLLAWAIAHKELKKKAEDTKDVEWDDDAVRFADEFIKAVTA